MTCFAYETMFWQCSTTIGGGTGESAWA